MKAYVPRPIEIDCVALQADLVILVERLSEHAHDIWAQNRMRDGWVLGAARSDETKSHPCLVPYAELPESEKHYDRELVSGVIRAMLALGYRIAPPA